MAEKNLQLKSWKKQNSFLSKDSEKTDLKKIKIK